MIDPAILLKLNGLGLTADQYAGVLEVIANVTETVTETVTHNAPSSANAERQRRYRERVKASRVTPSVASRVTADVTPPSPPSSPSPAKKSLPPAPPSKETNLFPDQPPRPSEDREPSPLEILVEALGEETAKAVMAHRKAKRSPISTPLAARGLVKGFREYPGGVQAAAEMMVTNGWTGFKREYWDKPGARGSPSRQQAETLPTFEDLARFYDAQAERESADIEGARPLLPHIPQH